MVNLKSGDFVKFNNKVFWVCRCADQPLNYLRNPSCQWCDMLRPTPLAPDVEACHAEQYHNDFAESGHKFCCWCGVRLHAGKA